jgi:Arc/MetJ-type ribon-helix-helix transcriptional regulator
MARPRIAGSDERIIQGFLSRRIYATQADVIRAALKALVTEQKQKDALRDSEAAEMDAAAVEMQLESAGSSQVAGKVPARRRAAGY